MAVLAPVVREWHRRRPQVTISLRESAVPEQLFGFVDDDEVDVLLVPGPVHQRYSSSVVAQEEVVLTAATGDPLVAGPTVRLQDLEGAHLVHFAADNGLGAWLDHSLSEAGVRAEAVMRTSITSAAPQLAAAGLGVAVTPVSAVGAGLPGAVRSFSPRWFRTLVAVTVAEPDPLVARFVADLTKRGLRVPSDIRHQLAEA